MFLAILASFIVLIKEFVRWFGWFVFAASLTHIIITAFLISGALMQGYPPWAAYEEWWYPPLEVALASVGFYLWSKIQRMR